MTSSNVHAWRSGPPDAILPGTAGEVMSAPPITVPVDTSVDEALRLMRHHDIHHLLLEDRSRIVAVVSDRNLARADVARSSTDDERRAQRPVFQVAQFQMAWVRQDTSLQEVARCLLLGGVSSLPVVNEAGEVAGILTSRDLLRHMAFGHLQRLWSSGAAA